MPHSLLANPGFSSISSYLQKPNAFLSRSLMWLAIAAFFYYSSVVFWQLIYPEGFQYKAPTVSSAPVQSSSQARAQRSWAWFVDSSVVKEPPPPPPSKIDARLLGVIAQSGADGELGIALIAVKNAPAVYTVGDELAPGIMLQRVDSSFVTLKRGDLSEILEMERPESIFKTAAEGGEQQPQTGQSARSAGASSPAPNQAFVTSPQELKTMLLDKPARLLEAVQLERYQDKEHGPGFRIRPQAGHESVLSMLGLNSDDVLLSVNNTQVTRIPMSQEKLAAILKAGPVKLKILREGVVTEVVVN